MPFYQTLRTLSKLGPPASIRFAASLTFAICFITPSISSMIMSLVIPNAIAHGTTITPESRIYKCRFRDNPENPSNPACKAAVTLGGSQALYDWNGINQANANGDHRLVVPDGELCGGGNSTYKGLNLARSDWMTTTMEPGAFEFIFHGTAPHATRDWVFYVTKEGWSPNTPLNWDDLVEFCRHGNLPLESDSQGRDVYRMACELPKRSGQHIIYNTWQRADSAEAFYTCMDVKYPKEPSSTNKCNGNSSGNASCVMPAINQLILGALK